MTQQKINEVIMAVKNYKGNDSFINSLYKYWYYRGNLTVKQAECAARFFNISLVEEAVDTEKTELYEITQFPVPAPVRTFSMQVGEKATIRKHFANKKAKELGLKVFFRNVIIEAVHDETPRAIKVSLSFDSKLTTYCHCCGRNLDTEISKATGVGEVCAKKYLGIKRVTMADAPLVLAKIEEHTKALGIIKDIWIPKSQFVTKAEQVLFNKE